MAFQKIIEAVKKYNRTTESLQTVRKAGFAECENNYKGDMLASKRMEVTRVYEESIAEAIAAFKAAVAEDVTATRSKIEAVTGVEVPVDLPASIAAIEAIGEGLTESAAQAMANKYKDNYFAFKAIVAQCQKFGKMSDVGVLNPEAALNAVKQAEAEALKWIGSAGHNSILDGFMEDEKMNPFVSLGAVVDKFTAKDFTLKIEF